MTTSTMKSLYKRLSARGFRKPYVQRVGLPDWWCDDAAQDPSALYQAQLTLARRFGLDLESVLNMGSEIQFKSNHCRLKTDKNTEDHATLEAQAVAHAIAEMVLAATRASFQPLPSSGAALRAEILGQNQPWVSLKSLVDYLWAHGVPVIHLANLHPSWRKMDGMVTKVKGRPAIILTRADKSLAWQLFILAHEVGHIIRGHLGATDTIADEKISKEASDPEEQEANRSAIEILTGDEQTKYDSGGTSFSPQSLAKAAIAHGQEHDVDPGHVALNYGYSLNQIPLGRAALRFIEPGADAPSLITSKLLEDIDPSALPDDSYDYLLTMCGVSE